MHSFNVFDHRMPTFMKAIYIFLPCPCAKKCTNIQETARAKGWCWTRRVCHLASTR